ncbi:GMP synthase - Glutamine amidotransferase domain [Halanaeroarchaeum sp. HSR-CO]|uniref:type 1 glutamine amidotransferase n=1 Tax=Halanaeroarchaeum sp. HSR-CO TaxID=2866382 RepID=UPI00217E18DB|nr:type 1 glutamine amidotransferase [Halanaeroarchaeum sp. HSR-CO]UWG49010.1 GMP synthase - Glutamine amidotransferase domain [Halanaeroarchaeum sp. HSR-CO]
MPRARLALLNAARDPEQPRRNFRRELAADLVEFHVGGGELPEDPAVDGVVVTGSQASVYWDEPWIDETVDWVREAVDRGLPTLGVCFGHQLVARALGGEVSDMGEYELGYREIRHDGDPLFDGLDERFTAFTTHSDTVESLPPGASVVAENDFGVQAFRTDLAVGVQFHPEYDRSTAERVTKRKDLPQERIDAVLADITDESVARAAPAAVVFENFLGEFVR